MSATAPHAAASPSLSVSTTPLTSVADLMAPWQADLARVKATLLEAVPTAAADRGEWLKETVAYTLDTPGKLLRPLLCLMVSAATQSSTSPEALSVNHTTTAAVAEMIHIATLLHDDVLDDADLRRGRQTVRLGWGNTVAILTGDYLLAQASRLLARMGHIRLVAIYSDVLADLCDGEIEQLRTQRQVVLDWTSYRQKTLCKTASLFGAVCESAGVLNALPETTIGQLRQFGEGLGLAFQIADDLLDYQSSQAVTGKPVLNDLRQGLLTAPVLLAFEDNRLSAAQQQDLRTLLETLFAEEDAAEATTTERLAAIQALLTTADAFTATADLAKTTLDSALAQLAQAVPDATRRQPLEALAQTLIYRNK